LKLKEKRADFSNIQRGSDKGHCAPFQRHLCSAAWTQNEPTSLGKGFLYCL